MALAPCKPIFLSTLPNQEIAAVNFLTCCDNALSRVDYKWFLSEALGYGHNPAFWQFHDPTVQAHFDRFSMVVNKWIDERGQQRKPMKVMQIQPRGTLKSGCVTTPAPIYAHLSIPDISVGVMSMNTDKADKFSGSIRTEMEGGSKVSRLTDLFGSFHAQGSGRKWSADAMVSDKRVNHKADPTVSSFTVRNSPVSGHFDLFIIDDPIDFEQMERDADLLDKVWSAFLGLKFVVNKDGLLYLIMTRYHESDLVGRIIREEIEPEVKRRTFLGKPEGQLPKDWDYDRGWIKYAHYAGWTVFYDEVYDDFGKDTQRPRYPVIWPEEAINEVRGASPSQELYFWTQLMNSPQRREDKPINDEHIRMAREWSLDEAPRMGWVDIHCDFAFKRADSYMKSKGDWNVAHVVVKKEGNIWRLNGYRGRVSQDEFGDKLIRLAYWAKDTWGSRIRFLSYDKLTGQGAGDESTKKWLWSLFAKHPDLNIPTIIEVPRRVKKLDYILSTAWAWQEGYVRLCKEAPFTHELCYQALYAGYIDHDDDIDAFSAAFYGDMYQSATGPSTTANEWTWRPAVDIGQDEDYPERDQMWGRRGWRPELN